MKILHISSGPSSLEYENIQKRVKDDDLNSSYGMPEASFKFNKLIIDGLKDNNADVEAIVGRSVSHKTHRGIIWKKNKHIENGIKYNHLFFINLPILKHLCICIGAFMCILFWLLKNKKQDKIIMIDGAYVSLIPIVNLFYNVNKICIVCDVYSYMANVMDAREKISFKSKIINKIMKSQYQKIDGFVFLTDEMSKLDAFKNKPYVVIEGLVDTSYQEKVKSDNYIMYAGALRKEYGIERLINAFKSIKAKNINLLLFGNGDYVSEIKKIAKNDSRIKYMGKKSLEEIYEYERNATLLINPRFAESEFTKYSFPSKNLEYMLSGTPLLTSKLPGMPKEYDKYVFLISNDSVEALKNGIENVLKKSIKELKEFGNKAQSFIVKLKNKKTQTSKILKLNKSIDDKKKSEYVKTIYTFEGINKYIPIVLCGGFFLVTILLLMFGPYDWHMANEKEVYKFLIIAFIMLILGYILAIKYAKVHVNKKKVDLNKWLTICIIAFIIAYIPTLYIRTGKLYPDIIRGIFNSGYAYRIAHSTNGTFIEYFRIIFSPFIAMVTPLCVMYYSRLNKFNKIAGAACILLTLLLGISCGISKQFADFVIQVFIFSGLLFFTKSKSNNWKKRCLIIIVLILTSATFVLYYKTIMSNRVNTDIIDNAAIDDINSNKTDSNKLKDNIIIDEDITNETMDEYSSFGIATLRENNFILSIIPQKFKSSILFLISYVTHGYKGLSLAMDENFTSAYGLGFSEFLRHNVSRIFGHDFEEKIYERTYMSKIEYKGWYTLNVWSSFFIYPASDIGFTLTVVLVLMIGFAFGYSWKDALVTGNIFAACSFYNFVILVFYLSANNQLFQTGEAFVSSCFIFIGYIIHIIKRGVLNHD